MPADHISMELRERFMGLRQLTDPDRAGGFSAVQNVQHWLDTQLLVHGNVKCTRGQVADDWGFLQGTLSFEMDGFLFDVSIRAVPKPCHAHVWPDALRCTHKGDDFVVLVPTGSEDEWEITYGRAGGGSITSPIDDARKNWAFDQTVRRYLKGEDV